MYIVEYQHTIQKMVCLCLISSYTLVTSAFWRTPRGEGVCMFTNVLNYPASLCLKKMQYWLMNCRVLLRGRPFLLLLAFPSCIQFFVQVCSCLSIFCVCMSTGVNIFQALFGHSYVRRIKGKEVINLKENKGVEGGVERRKRNWGYDVIILKYQNMKKYKIQHLLFVFVFQCLVIFSSLPFVSNMFSNMTLIMM